MHSVLGMVAVQHDWFAVELYELPKPIGVIAVTSKAVSAFLAERSAAEGMHSVLGMVAVQHDWFAVELYELQKPIGVIAVTSKAVSAFLAEQQCCRGHAQGLRHGCCAA